MKNLVSGMFALAWFVMLIPAAAQAGPGTVNYKPGALKAAVAKGETVLLFYKSTW